MSRPAHPSRPRPRPAPRSSKPASNSRAKRKRSREKSVSQSSISEDQWTRMFYYLEANRNTLLGFTRIPESKMWVEMADVLNKCEGCIKSSQDWKEVWYNRVKKALSKVQALEVYRKSPKGTPPTALNVYDERVLSISGNTPKRSVEPPKKLEAIPLPPEPLPPPNVTKIDEIGKPLDVDTGDDWEDYYSEMINQPKGKQPKTEPKAVATNSGIRKSAISTGVQKLESNTALTTPPANPVPAVNLNPIVAATFKTGLHSSTLNSLNRLPTPINSASTNSEASTVTNHEERVNPASFVAPASNSGASLESLGDERVNYEDDASARMRAALERTRRTSARGRWSGGRGARRGVERKSSSGSRAGRRGEEGEDSTTGGRSGGSNNSEQPIASSDDSRINKTISRSTRKMFADNSDGYRVRVSKITRSEWGLYI